MHTSPTSAEVLAVIGEDGVVVGSWPRKRDGAKDIDIVIRPAPNGERNPIFVRLLAQWRENCDSAIMGHLIVYADPQPIELFEITLPPDDPDKRNGVLTYRQASRGAERVNVHGISMRVAKAFNAY